LTLLRGLTSPLRGLLSQASKGLINHSGIPVEDPVLHQADRQRQREEIEDEVMPAEEGEHREQDERGDG